jgi:hypothetical protein
MTISISGQVPAKEQNGMYDLEADWTEERTPDPVLAVVKIERDGLKFKDADALWSATSKFTHIEPLEGEDADLARALLEKAYAKRTGNESLPMPLPEPSDVQEPVLDLDTPLEDKEPAEADEPELDEEQA